MIKKKERRYKKSLSGPRFPKTEALSQLLLRRFRLWPRKDQTRVLMDIFTSPFPSSSLTPRFSSSQSFQGFLVYISMSSFLCHLFTELLSGAPCPRFAVLGPQSLIFVVIFLLVLIIFVIFIMFVILVILSSSSTPTSSSSSSSPLSSSSSSSFS